MSIDDSQENISIPENQVVFFLKQTLLQVSFSKRKDGRKSRGKKRIVLEFEGSHPRAKDFSCNGIEKKS